MTKTWTIVEIIKWGTAYLEEKGIESPRLNIERMLCAAAGLQRLDLYMKFDRPLAADELEKLRAMIKRRVRREPLQYILGETEFYGVPFQVDSSVLIPRPETEHLIEHALACIRGRGWSQGRILDIGTGSGCIAVALAERCNSMQVCGIDVSPDCLNTARKNALARNVANVDFCQCDILCALPPAGPYNVIVSNPPYIALAEYRELEPEVNKFEPRSALTDGGDGLSFYRRFARIFPDLLDAGGVFFVEIGYNMAKDVSEIFRASGFTVQLFKDYSGIPRVLQGELA